MGGRLGGRGRGGGRLTRAGRAADAGRACGRAGGRGRRPRTREAANKEIILLLCRQAGRLARSPRTPCGHAGARLLSEEELATSLFTPPSPHIHAV